MCGIYLRVHSKNYTSSYDSFLKTRHRGPDGSSFISGNLLFIESSYAFELGFHHLKINDLSNFTGQPFFDADGSFCVSNAEIYNSEAIKKEYLEDYTFRTESDCEVILPLYLKYGEEFVHMIDGEYSIVLYSSRKKELLVIRDPVGVRPLYFATDESGIHIASELKSISSANVNHFPIGSYLQIHDMSNLDGFTKFYEIQDMQNAQLSFDEASKKIREKAELAVRKRLISRVPIGALLSGGIDSSGIAALAARNYAGELETFTLVIEGLDTEDDYYARIVANHIGSKHHEVSVTLSEIFSSIDHVIGVIETYNMEMIPNLILIYLLAKYIREKTPVRVLLNGTGPDELLGGYWFFDKAPDDRSFICETLKQTREMHRTELLEDRAFANFGMEVRYPYLDKEFVEAIMCSQWGHRVINKRKGEKLEGNIEKKLLRQSLRDLLPDSVINRKKLGMTHGAGKHFETIFDEEIRRRLQFDPGNDVSHGRLIGLEGYYKHQFEIAFPFAKEVDCMVTPAEWRRDDHLAVWR